MSGESAADNVPGRECQFATRLYSLPVVTSAVGQLNAMYAYTKERNRLFRFTLETAESGLGIAVRTAHPIVTKFEKPIGSLNDIACHQLEKLEHDYPIITKPTDEVLNTTKETCTTAVKPITDRVSSALETVKPITDRVGSVAQYSLDKATGIKVYACDTVEGARTYGVGQINRATSYGASKIADVRVYGVSKIDDAKAYGVGKLTSVTEFGARNADRLLDNETGRTMVFKLDNTLQLADYYVDQYLPESTADSHDDDVNKSPESGDAPGNKSPESEDIPREPSVVAARAFDLSYKVGRRGYARVSKSLQNMKLRSMETLTKLNFTVDLLEYARNNMNGATSKLNYIWLEVNKSPEETVKEEAETEKTYERRAIATARHLAQRLKVNLSGVNLDLLPGVVRDRVHRAVDLTQSVYQTYTQSNFFQVEVYGVTHSLGYVRRTLLFAKPWIPTSLTPAFDRMLRIEEREPTEEGLRLLAAARRELLGDDFDANRKNVRFDDVQKEWAVQTDAQEPSERDTPEQKHAHPEHQDAAVEEVDKLSVRSEEFHDAHPEDGEHLGEQKEENVDNTESDESDEQRRESSEHREEHVGHCGDIY